MNYLQHHGILGQKWGVRNGPPYPLKGGQYSRTEKEALKGPTKRAYSTYNKRHYDDTIKKGSDIVTLSYNPDRTKDTQMFYASHTNRDKDLYMARYNVPTQKAAIMSKQLFKKRIVNKATADVKIASEDSAAEIFRDLYENDRDFYNFVTDEKRMQGYFVNAKYVYKGYREARDVIEKIRTGETPTDKELQVAYRMFNYVIPVENKDMANQRAKFFDKCRDKGYDALLDTNDALYATFHADSPIIMFNQEKIALEGISDTKVTDTVLAQLKDLGRNALGIRG